jgi:hypothetical protein
MVSFAVDISAHYQRTHERCHRSQFMPGEASRQGSAAPRFLRVIEPACTSGR